MDFRGSVWEGIPETEDGDLGGVVVSEQESGTFVENEEGDDGRVEDVSVTREAHSCSMFIKIGAGRLSSPFRRPFCNSVTSRGEK